MFDTMKEPIEFGGPRSAVGVVEHGLEVLEGLLVRLLDGERLAEVADVVDALQLRDSRREHHREKSYEQIGVSAEREVGFAAQFLEIILSVLKILFYDKLVVRT